MNYILSLEENLEQFFGGGIVYLQAQGVSEEALLLLLFLPVVITTATFFRLVIGFSPGGSRTPLLFSYALFVLGWGLGSIVLCSLACSNFFFQRLCSHWRLLYAAKVGVLVSLLGIFLLFITAFSASFSWALLDYPSALMMVIITALIDRVAGEEGWQSLPAYLRSFLEAFFIGAAGTLLMGSAVLQAALLHHPETLILVFLLNVIMGRFTGLRLIEYFRFREVLKSSAEE